MRRDPQSSHHLATISHDGRFWDAYLELAEASGPGQAARGRIAFSAADAGDDVPVRTATIFIEETQQEVVARARELKTHHLVALLRSAIPTGSDDDPDTGPHPEAGEEPATDPAADQGDAAGDQGDAAEGP